MGVRGLQDDFLFSPRILLHPLIIINLSTLSNYIFNYFLVCVVFMHHLPRRRILTLRQIQRFSSKLTFATALVSYVGTNGPICLSMLGLSFQSCKQRGQQMQTASAVSKFIQKQQAAAIFVCTSLEASDFFFFLKNK